MGAVTLPASPLWVLCLDLSSWDGMGRWGGGGRTLLKVCNLGISEILSYLNDRHNQREHKNSNNNYLLTTVY